MFLKRIVWFFPPFFGIYVYFRENKTQNIWNKEFCGRTFIQQFLSFELSFFHKGTLHHLIAEKES